MPHSEYMKLDNTQQRNFHSYHHPPMPPFNPWETTAKSSSSNNSPAPAAIANTLAKSDSDANSGGNGSGTNSSCPICHQSAELRKFKYVDKEWTICFDCAQAAFAAKGIRLWLDGKAP